MGALKSEAVMVALAVVLGAIALYMVKKNAGSIGAGAVGAVADAGVGAVLGIGDAVGVPRTDQTQCQRDIAAGNLWDASFSCPAADWLKAVGNKAGAIVN